jgi:putative hemolysin
MILLLLAIGIAFIFSAIFSGSEMAYLSCNKLKLRHLADEGDRRAKQVIGFHRNPKRFLTMVLIGNNLMHVIVVGLATYFFEAYLHIHEEWVVTAVLAFPLIVFAETIPKDWFRNKADDFIYRFAPVLGFLNQALSGISDVLVGVTDFFIRSLTGDIKHNPMITREEFRYVIEESTKGGVVLEHEKQLINTILNLDSVRVQDVMTPVAKFPKVPLTSKVRDIKNVARQTATQAVLVYEELPAIVIGLVYVFDVLFEEHEQESLSRYLKAPLFIPSDASAEKALFQLQAKHASYGAVINLKGEVIGVVSIENLIAI